MDNLYFDTFAFFVPYRTIWDNHHKFHGAQDNPGDSIAFSIPVLTGTETVGQGDLADHFGLPLAAKANDVNMSALPFRAYGKIYNDWFRSGTLQNSITVPTDNGPDTNAESRAFDNPLQRTKRFDYFTSCLPAPQRGTAVALPLGTTADVRVATAIGGFPGIYSTSAADYQRIDVGGAVADISATVSPSADKMYADLTNAAAATLNDVRLAFATQHVLERDARAGTRYVEVLLARWGVTSPDFRLQRAEYLGGGSTPINITPVQQQSAQTTPVANDKLGELAGYGTAAGTHSWTKSFVEHGVVIMLGNLRGDISYSQGIDRYWGKQTRYEFVYPELVNIGEQAVTQVEIWNDTASPANNAIIFGYQGRYDEHRFLNSKITGLHRPDASGTLAAWNLSEDFATAPTLGNLFISANTRTPLDRAIAIPTEPHMIADFYHNIRAARPLPTFGVPGLTRL